MCWASILIVFLYPFWGPFWEVFSSKLDENVVQDLQGRFDSIQGKMDGLAEKSGAELVSALNEIKAEGAELAAKLKEATGTVTSEEGDVAATPAPSETP